MKLSASLVHAITLGVTVTAITATATSCEKEKIKQKTERTDDTNVHPQPTECAACGMG